jgi:hypothetical protein
MVRTCLDKLATSVGHTGFDNSQAESFKAAVKVER